MSKELSKDLMVVVMRNGVEISIEAVRLGAILPVLEKRGFAMIEGRVINAVDVVGIFKPIDLEETGKRKNGQWKCGKGVWHEKEDKCKCFYPIPEYAKAWIK